MRRSIRCTLRMTPDLDPTHRGLYGELPNRLLTAFEVAQFVGCHEETVRRAYLRGLLASRASASGAALSSARRRTTGSVAARTTRVS